MPSASVAQLPSPDVWLVLSTGPGHAAWNMGVDDVLLNQVAVIGHPILRFYGWSEPAATFGYSQRYVEIAALTPLRPLIRRPTGGGLVPHANDWTYSVVVPPGHDWYALSAVASYQRIHDWLRRSLAHCGITTALAPCCDPAGPGQCFVGAEKHDLLLGDSKIAGAAQRRNRQGLLIQGSVQLPPDTLLRQHWEAAMPTVGSGTQDIFTTWELPPALLAEAEIRTAERFSTPAHNQRR